MIITVKNKDGERQKPIVTIDTETCHYPYAIREAIELALELDGYTKETIDEVFGRQREDCKVESEPIGAGNTLAVDASKPSGIQTKPPYYYVHGQKFKAYIEGLLCEGKVSIDENTQIFLCQNTIGISTSENEILGFKYSIWSDKGTKQYLEAAKVENLLLYPL